MPNRRLPTSLEVSLAKSQETNKGNQLPKLAVLHLSDIHIKTSSDIALGFSTLISSAAYDTVRNADACLVAITGDIAYSGSAAQYRDATSRLLEPIVSGLASETGKPVYVASTPGNHDCVLVPKDSIREAIIEKILEEPEKVNDKTFVDLCTSVQKDYFEFADKTCNPPIQLDDKLFWTQQFDLHGKKVHVSCLNAAWMSRLPEQQGQLVYPISRYNTSLSVKADLHLALVHHPMNWYEQTSYQQLRKRLRLSCTAVLSGHEHLPNAGKIEESATGTSLFFEAAALQPHEANLVPGFSVYLFDLDKKTLYAQQFEISGKAVRAIDEKSHHSWEECTYTRSVLDVTEAFLNRINDAGGNFTHTAKERLSLDDIFIWPDLKNWTKSEFGKQEVISGRSLPELLCGGGRFIVYGDEKSGKSSLLYRVFHELLLQGYAPVYLNSSEVNIKSIEDAKKRIDQAIVNQYKSPGDVQLIERSRRVILIDDIDGGRGGSSGIAHLLTYAELHFGGACITAASGFEVTNLTSREAAIAIAPFDSYDLMRFGLKLRHQLIKKWCGLSEPATKSELDKRVDDVEVIVNAVIGRQLVPEHPIYLLILLQSSDQHRHGEIQNSGLSFYYQYLITKSLGEVGVKPGELDEHFNYLSILAWKFEESDSKELDLLKLRSANNDFCEKFFTVDLESRLTLLYKARLLTKVGDSVAFSYPYIYHFFVGRYLAKNLDNQAIRDWVEESCRKLYLRDRAHSIMFLTHHVENKWVIGLICDVLRNCFSEKQPAQFNGDIDKFNALVDRSTQLTLGQTDVERNQTEIREHEDSLDDMPQHEESVDTYDDLSFNSKWNLLHKTAEILGLILKNYYGSLERNQKQEMIREVFDAPLRALRLWLDEVSIDLEGLVSEIKSISNSDIEKKSPYEQEVIVRRRLFGLFGMVASGVVVSAGSFVSSDKLREDVARVVAQSPNNAYRLIEVASRLLRPGSIPMNEIRQLAKELERNHYAFSVLQTLGYMHMYMFHTEESQKQSLAKLLKISVAATRTLEVMKAGRRIH